MKRVLFGMLLLAACHAPLAPLTGDVYVLRSIAGVPVPAPYPQNPANVDNIITDTIAFLSANIGERRTVYGSRSGVERTKFTYTRNDSRVEIWFPCPANADCVAGPHIVGNLSSSDFVGDITRTSRGPLVYTRLIPLE
jgi:hypothetical protein